MTPAILYARFSDRPNAQECESIAAQLEACRNHCAVRGYAIAAEFSDQAMSGGDADRPGLWSAVDVLSRGDVLIVWRLDRLARDVYLSETIQRQVDKSGARIEYVTGGGNDDTPEGELIRRILQAFSEYERKIIAIRTSYAMKRHQANGRKMGGNAPYGFAVDPDDESRLIECPDEQGAITEARRLAEAGHGLRTIARMLAMSGYRPRGDAWRHQTVKSMIEAYRSPSIRGTDTLGAT
jgi:site-specific DNA recombinase